MHKLIKNFALYIFTWLVFFSLILNTSSAEDSAQIKEDLKDLNKADQSGLSTVIKAITPEGGRFEIQKDGAIRITPDDASIVKKLLPKETTEPASKDPSKSPSGESEAKKLPEDTEELMKRLQEANAQGLSTILNKLSADGGRFELIEGGGIKIIPSDSQKSKDLLGTATHAEKIIKDRNVTNTLFVENIKTPINSIHKARALSGEWVKYKGLKDVYVGKIRNIKWLYLVSIVKTKNNHMDTQLVIRVNDGRTTAIRPDEYEVYDLDLSN